MSQFITHDRTGRIHSACRIPDIGGVQALTPMPHNGLVFRRWDQPIALSGASPTQALYWIDDAPQWVETAPLADIRTEAINSIDAAGEALRLAVLSKMPTQTSEYVRAEAQARAWAAADYTGPAPRSITAWSNAKHRDGWTARQACEDILTTADGWYDILDTIRELRLAKKEDVRHAGADEIAPIVASMTASMRGLAEQLNLTLAE